jgi:hypothetical protein
MCGLSLIIEEIDAHNCRRVIDILIINAQVLLGDGKNYYPLKLPQQPRVNTENNSHKDNRTLQKNK